MCADDRNDLLAWHAWLDPEDIGVGGRHARPRERPAVPKGTAAGPPSEEEGSAEEHGAGVGDVPDGMGAPEADDGEEELAVREAPGPFASSRLRELSGHGKASRK